MEAALEQKLENLSTEPGVYLMKDRQGQVIYVGKAVNLRSRVRSYFHRATSDSRAFVALLDGLLGDLDTVVVSNEKEALLLENELIKRHKPRFNVQLRDDKNFICLRLDESHPYPRLEVVRRFKKDGARYFGPYSSAGAIRESLRIVNRYFQLRTCSDHALEHRRRPCLLYQLGRCPAPCVYEVPAEEYQHNVESVRRFLEGRADSLIAELEQRMARASAELKFEEAARLRDQLSALRTSLERQQVATSELIDQDVFGYAREADRLVIYAVYVRNGRISGGQPFFFAGQEFPDEELLGSFVNLYYAHDNFVPKEVLLPLELPSASALAELLSERKGEKVRVLTPRRGEKLAQIELAKKNAERALVEKGRSREELSEILERLRRRLDLSRLPRRMECFDVSHFQGSSVVASQVAISDGELDRGRYRRFNVKTVDGNDDFASMYEVLRRRLTRGVAVDDLPDLIVVDGGKGQLASAHAALRDTKVTGVDLVALAKSRELEGGDEGKKSPERVFLVGRKDPIVLPQRSPELFLLTRLRDEAHRFAITFQKQRMRRRALSSLLEEIPGVGEGRKRALLRHFGSLARVKKATIEDLSEVDGVGPALAECIHGFLHGSAELSAKDPVRETSLEDAIGD